MPGESGAVTCNGLGVVVTFDDLAFTPQAQPVNAPAASPGRFGR